MLIVYEVRTQCLHGKMEPHKKERCFEKLSCSRFCTCNFYCHYWSASLVTECLKSQLTQKTTDVSNWINLLKTSLLCITKTTPPRYFELQSGWLTPQIPFSNIPPSKILRNTASTLQLRLFFLKSSFRPHPGSIHRMDLCWFKLQKHLSYKALISSIQEFDTWLRYLILIKLIYNMQLLISVLKQLI